MAFALSRTSTLDSSFTSHTTSSSSSSRSFVAPNSRRAIRYPKSPKSPSSKYLSLPLPSSSSAPSSVSLALNLIAETPHATLQPFPSTPSLHNSTSSMYSYAPTAPSMPTTTAPPPSRGQAAYPRPRAADSPTTSATGSTKPKGVNKVLSAFGLRSSSSSSSAKAAQAKLVQEIQERERSRNAMRIRDAAGLVREQGRKLVQRIKRKISSKSPEEDKPKTWEEYVAKYARHEIDVEDPPLPPPRPADLPGDIQTPFESRAFSPPASYNEAARQAVVDHLDLFGTKTKRKASQQTLAIQMQPSASTDSAMRSGDSSLQRTGSTTSTGRDQSDAASLTGSTRTHATIQAETVESMKDNAVFRDIISRCKEIFGSKVSMLTILDDAEQLFLCTGGMDLPGMLPRSVTFCSHAVLDDDNRGMVVLDAKNDWRFANGLPATQLGARFYAGVPLLAPTFGDSSAPGVPIGTLCVADDKPRDGFTEEQRQVLFELAAQASQEVESWVNARMEGKLNRLEDVFHAAALGPAATSTAELDTPPLTPPAAAHDQHQIQRQLPASKLAPSAALPATPPQSQRGSTSHSREGSFSDVTSIASGHSSRRGSDTSALRNPSSNPYRRPSTAPSSSAHPLSLATTTEAPVTTVPKDLQRVFDQGVKMLAKALALDLVYLVALDLPSSSSRPTSAPTLRVLAAHGLTNPAPSFDPALHLRALRAEEGGLLYKNPRYSGEGEGLGFASGMLIPILEVRRVGYVLSGYTKESDRAFEQKDLSLMVKFAEQLEGYVTKLGRSNSQVQLRAP